MSDEHLEGDQVRQLVERKLGWTGIHVDFVMSSHTTVRLLDPLIDEWSRYSREGRVEPKLCYFTE
jgi:hypothetical protein